METHRRPFSSAIFWLGLGVVLFAVGAKLALIQRVGTDQPYADQWAAEGMYFLRGPLYYDVDFGQIISTHGEHRPGLTRLWVLGLVAANGGQWDCFVELVANLLIYGVFLLVAWRWVMRLTQRSGLAVAAFFLAVMFALPGNYENFLWGFQSCFLFMLLAGLVHVTGTMASDRPGVRWCLSQLVGLMGLFSIAGGAMSAATLVAMAGFELLRGRRGAWVWATLLVNAVLFGLGLWLLPEGAPSENSMITRLWAGVVRTGYMLSWPFSEVWWGLLFQTPLVGLLVSAWRNRNNQEQVAGDGRLFAVGLWMAGMSFAIAYGRDVTPQTIGARYFDGLVLGLFVNLLALIRIHARLTGWRCWAWRAGGLAWVLAAGLGLWHNNNPQNLRPLFKYQHDLAVEQRQIVRDFLVSDDPARLQEFDSRAHRFPHMEYTLIFLRDPKVAPLLPPSLTPDGHAGPLSRWAVRIAALWPIVLGAGVFLMLLGMVRLRRDPNQELPT